MVDVPCGACRLCCRLVTPLYPARGDDPAQYETTVLHAPGKPPQLILARRANGDCIYLGIGQQGCLIHERAPSVCRDFDCRDAYRNNPLTSTPTTQAIVNRGRELLEGLLD